MTRIAITAVALALMSAAGSALAADRAHPAVLELFQSQGCSSCPPANAELLKLVDRPHVLALSFQVTYWDGLGWKDTFAQPSFTARQWEYARRWGRKEVATPEVVVNGRVDGVGSNPGEMTALLAKADRGGGGPVLTVGPKRVEVGAGRGAGSVWLVRYDPRVVSVPIRAGENAGRTLPHRNVVRELVRLGDWRGAAATFALPPPTRPGLATAVLLQDGAGGPVLAAARR